MLKGFKRYLPVIVIIIIGGGVATFLYFRSTDTKSVPSAPNASSTTSRSMPAGSNAIYVAEQSPGSTVSVGFVLLAQPGFVVIHEDTGGNAGTIVGVSSLLGAGGTEQADSITLFREIKDGEELIAMLHRDDGDGTFDVAKDLPVQDEKENTIMMNFIVNEDAQAPGAVSL